MGRDQNLYNDPLSYKPERWLRDNKEEKVMPNLAFGHGARMCIGKRPTDVTFLSKLFSAY